LFLRQLKGEVGGPWTIVWDRNQIHSKSRVVKEWLAGHPEIVVEDFPGHAPDTNADEEVWSWTKSQNKRVNKTFLSALRS
jgi:hypothetical protein